MKFWRTISLAFAGLLAAGVAFSQSDADATQKIRVSDNKIVTFRFVPGKDMFYVPWKGNASELDRLYSLVDKYREQIVSGAMPVHVDGYVAGDRLLAKVRSNRVKSELITRKGLREGHFVTQNHVAAYTDADGMSHRDIVVVTLIIPTKTEIDRTEQARFEAEQERLAAEQAEKERAERERLISEQRAARERAEREAAERAERERLEAEQAAALAKRPPFRLAVRTNLLYDAFLLPTIGIEWRVTRDIGVKLDGSYGFWGSEHGKVQKMWFVSPEVRWYLLSNKCLYVGAGANFGEYNIYKVMVGTLLSKDTGYQGKLWNVGLTVGYQLHLNRIFSLDFNIGMGYTRSEYDSFNVIDDVRTFKSKGQTKNLWGPTQAGVNLIWTIGGKK